MYAIRSYYELQYLQAKTQKEALEESKKALAEQIALTKIIAPISGSIENNPLKVGEMANPGAPNSVVRIINMTNAKVTAKVAVITSYSIHYTKLYECRKQYAGINTQYYRCNDHNPG